MSEELKFERFALEAEVKELRDKVKAYERTAEKETARAVGLDMERVAITALLDAIGWVDLHNEKKTIPAAIAKLYGQVKSTAAELEQLRLSVDRQGYRERFERHAMDALKTENASLRRHIDALQQMLADKKEKKE